MRFIPGIEDWLNILKVINIIPHISRIKEKKYGPQNKYIISICYLYNGYDVDDNVKQLELSYIAGGSSTSL